MVFVNRYREYKAHRIIDTLLTELPTLYGDVHSTALEALAIYVQQAPLENVDRHALCRQACQTVAVLLEYLRQRNVVLFCRCVTTLSAFSTMLNCRCDKKYILNCCVH